MNWLLASDSIGWQIVIIIVNSQQDEKLADVVVEERQLNELLRLVKT